MTKTAGSDQSRPVLVRWLTAVDLNCSESRPFTCHAAAWVCGQELLHIFKALSLAEVGI